MTTPHAPQVYLIARPQIDFEEVARFLADRKVSWLRSKDASSAEEIVEIAGRICYMSFNADTKKISYPNSTYICNLIDKGHESVLEHATWSFIIDRVSRAFTHQLVRHRIGFSYSQLSQQYHDESEGDFVQPIGLAEFPELAERWRAAVERTRGEYRDLLSLLSEKMSSSTQSASSTAFETQRWLRSAARSLLPNATETTVAITANARALRNFFHLRGAILGDPEMRQVTLALYRSAAMDAPTLFADFEAAETEDGVGLVRRRPKTDVDAPPKKGTP